MKPSKNSIHSAFEIKCYQVKKKKKKKKKIQFSFLQIIIPQLGLMIEKCFWKALHNFLPLLLAAMIKRKKVYILKANLPLHLDICNETCPDLSKQILLDVFHESLHMS